MKFNPNNAHWQEAKRRCPDCGVSKLLKRFYGHRSRPNGRSVYCKKCTDIRTNVRRSFQVLPRKNKKVQRWFSDPSLAQSYIGTFASRSEAAKKSGVGIATIYAILGGRRVKESTEEKIIAAAVRLAV